MALLAFQFAVIEEMRNERRERADLEAASAKATQALMEKTLETHAGTMNSLFTANLDQTKLIENLNAKIDDVSHRQERLERDLIELKSEHAPDSRKRTVKRKKEN